VDNAIEAKASRIDIFFDQAKRQKGKKDAEAVTAVCLPRRRVRDVPEDGSLRP